MVQYRNQLSLAQANLQQKDREHMQSIQKLQDQVRALELSLAGQATLPSIAASSSKTGLHARRFSISFPVQSTNAGELHNMRARIRPSHFRNRLGLRTITAVLNLGLL